MIASTYFARWFLSTRSQHLYEIATTHNERGSRNDGQSKVVIPIAQHPLQGRSPQGKWEFHRTT
jgi:hypothetical protein